MAANSVKGDVAFKAIGKPWTIVGGFLATCQLEAEFDMPAAAVIATVFPDIEKVGPSQAEQEEYAKRIRVLDVVRIMKALLEFHHPDIEDREVQLIINDLEPVVAMDTIGKALHAAKVPEGARMPERGGVRPPKASRSKRIGTP